MTDQGFPTYREILPDTSKYHQDLREIQKTVQYYGKLLLFVPNKVDKILKDQEAILETLRELQGRMKKLEERPSSSGKKIEGYISFGAEPLRGKATVVQRPLTDDEKLLAAINKK